MHLASALTPVHALVLTAVLAAVHGFVPLSCRGFEHETEHQTEHEPVHGFPSETGPSTAAPPSGLRRALSAPDHPLSTTKKRADGREPRSGRDLKAGRRRTLESSSNPVWKQWNRRGVTNLHE
jgi:hypothetical protein